MPRKAREISENGIYYIYTRSVEEGYLCEKEGDFEVLRHIIAGAKEAHHFALFAYAVTKCELHMVIKEFSPGEVSKAMKKICFEFTKYRNLSREGGGKLFKDRFKSRPVPLDDEFLPLLKFVHLVPVKNGECFNISSYRYCSYNDYFNAGELVDTGGVMHYFGGDTEEGRRKFKLFHAGFPTADLKMKERFSVSRDQVREIIFSVCGLQAEEIRMQEREKRDFLLRKIKKSTKLSVRQMAFATKLSRNTISAVLKEKVGIL